MDDYYAEAYKLVGALLTTYDNNVRASILKEYNKRISAEARAEALEEAWKRSSIWFGDAIDDPGLMDFKHLKAAIYGDEPKEE